MRPYTETWHYKVAQKHRMIYRNYGMNGNCIAFDRTKQGYGKPMYERYREMNDSADYVLVIAGHNDVNTLSRRADSLDVFRERLDVLCNGLIEKYPSARIAFVTPWNFGGLTLPVVINVIKDVCAKHSIPVLDAASTSGIHVRNAHFRELYCQSEHDNAHLNDAGHDLLIHWGESFLLSL